MVITFVKKILADGTPCRKCKEVEERLQEADLLQRIDNIVIADERDAASEGMQLAREYQVSQAPFFTVTDDDGATRVYTVFFRFLNEVLNRKTSALDENKELLEQNPDLDFL